MNPSEFPNRIIDGEEFRFEKVIRKRGKVLRYMYKSDSGVPAYITAQNLRVAPAPKEGIIYRQPFFTLVSLAMFFVRR